MDQLEGYENINTGLLDLPETPWPQTAYIGAYGYHSRYGQSTAQNAIYYSTLLRAAGIADRVGDSSKAQGWRDKAQTIRRMTNSLLYLSSDHRYITNIYQEAPYPPTPQAQAWALAYGLVPDDEIDQVVSSLIELISPDPSSPNLSIYGMFWALEALGRTEHIPEALEIIQNYYGAQINSGATTWWERFDAIDSFRTCLSHGWGGSPTWYLTTYVLGAKRLGANTWMIKPSFNGVTHVSGILPLKNGELHARWDIISAQDKTVEVVSNEGLNGEIVVPYTNPTLVLTLDGEIIWEDQKSLVENVFDTPGEVHIVISGGNHTLHLHQGD